MGGRRDRTAEDTRRACPRTRPGTSLRLRVVRSGPGPSCSAAEIFSHRMVQRWGQVQRRFSTRTSSNTAPRDHHARWIVRDVEPRASVQPFQRRKVQGLAEGVVVAQLPYARRNSLLR